ncbi:MAG: site-2 protease family protein [Deltaproteobacteria bacterium]|nr:site-2 protease family protein [Deltaproteobacteria bacterium]
MGAVIRMKVVKKRLQLLDVGASGPLAGMAVALPLAIAGIALSPIEEVPKGAHLILGDNLLFAGIVRLVHGPVAEGYDVFLHPIGLAAWFGFLVTALNLMPASQLDGGHIVKALVGRRHAAISRFVFLVLTVWGALGDAILVDPRLALTGALYVAGAVTLLVTRRFKKYERRILFALFLAHFAWATVVEANSVAMPWMVWSVLLFAFRLDHPPIEDEHAPLPFRRRAAGWASLALFVLTFTPMPITITGI